MKGENMGQWPDYPVKSSSYSPSSLPKKFFFILLYFTIVLPLAQVTAKMFP